MIQGATYQIIECIPRFGGINRTNISKVVKNTLRGRRPVIEKEHNPSVDHGSSLQGYDDSSFIIRIIVDKVPDCFKNLRSLFVVEDVVSSPDLVSQY